ncbi:MAG: WD40/YVTN/BNR-like repeat-containing protein, partial [Candidatus Latescibacterota bacterium]
MHNILIGTRKGLFIYEKQTQGWVLAKKEFLGIPVNMVMADPRDKSLYAVLLHGHFGTKIHRSTDNGQTWAEIATPQYPSDLPKEKRMSSEPEETWYQPKLEKIWSLTPGHASQPNVLWCGTIPGGLFKSTDKGNSWELITSLWDREERKQWFGGGEDYAGLHSICVHPTDPNDVIIGVSCGGAWHTPDGGQTWNVRSKGMFAEYMPPDQRDNPIFQDPHRIVQCLNNPDTLWTQHHNGGFGHALEPDIRCPNSQPVPVEHALKILDTVGFDAQIAQSACDYLLTITTSEGGVPWIMPSAHAYPRAPWWNAQENQPASLNPTAGLAALLHKNNFQHNWLAPATEFCWKEIATLEPNEMHTMGVALSFLYHASDRDRAERELARLIDPFLQSDLVADINDTGYVRKPLDWAGTPDHPLRKYFKTEDIEANLDVLI